MVESLTVAGVFGLLAGSVYATVGRVVQTRPVTDRNRTANTLFATWWYTLGAVTIIGAVNTLAASRGYTNLSTFVALTHVNILLLCAGLLGLLYYLGFLFTGKSALLRWFTVFYVGYYFLLVYYIQRQKPDGVELTGWTARLHYANPAAQDALYAVVIALLLLPQIIGALAFFTLYFRVDDPEQKYRIAVVSWSIVIWFGSALVASFGNLQDNVPWQVTSRLIGLSAALAILGAYVPPKFIKRRLVKASAPMPAPAAPPTMRRVDPLGSAPVGRTVPTGTAS